MTQAQQVVNNPYKDVVDQLITSASFLWILKENSTRQIGYSLDDKYDYEHRLERQLNSLMLYFEDAWELSLESLGFNDSGDAFVCAVLAFRSLDSNNIQFLLEKCNDNPSLSKGLISALAWLPSNIVGEWLSKFIQSKDLFHKYIAIYAYRIRNEKPGVIFPKLLERDDCIQNEKLYGQCLRLIGELKLNEHKHLLSPAFNDERKNIQFWAQRSAVFLGDHSHLKKIQEYSLVPTPYQESATSIALRISSIADARNLIAKMIEHKTQSRIILYALRVLGDTQAIPWVINKMEDPVLARFAGHTFSTITGIDILKQGLVFELPELASPEELENQEADLDIDIDENLAWPDVQKIKATWQRYSQNFPAGQRLLHGKMLSASWLMEKYDQVSVYEQQELATELALIQTQKPLQNPKQRIYV